MKSCDEDSYNAYRDEFENIYSNDSFLVTDEVLREYSRIYRKPKVLMYEFDKTNMRFTKQGDANAITYTDKTPIIRPNDAQIEALYELRRVREHGATKALVVAATGVGKTFLATFDSVNFKRVLFVSHREEIIQQAYATFKAVRPDVNVGICDANNKDMDCEVVIASVQTLSKTNNLERVAEKFFDYIIIDEFHHSAAKTYQKILSYFRPKFLLGLTATPNRMDNKDIYAYCDYNIAYEIDLFSAINRGWLVPFHYYGIYDITVNYDNITYIRGKYLEEELEKSLCNEDRYELVFKHYLRHNSKKIIGFCASIKHAENMAKFFEKKNIRAVAIHSKSNNRKEMMQEFREGNIKIIFAIDIFNEGVDIPSIDMVLFLRPTESPVVFLQQLGRGLRLEKGKTHLTVLDFIGNYKKVNLLPLFLSGKNHLQVGSKWETKNILESDFFPEGCKVNFDMRIVDLIEKHNMELRSISSRIKDEYIRIKEDLEKAPNRCELLTYFCEDLYITMKKNSAHNIFKDYISFLHKMGEKPQIYGTIAHEFIKMIENTSMSKLYKIPILLAFYNNGDVRTHIGEKEILESFKIFYEDGQNRLDMLKDKSTREFGKWMGKKYLDLAYKNPIKYLCKTESKFFTLGEGGALHLLPNIKKHFRTKDFIENFKDVIEFRRIKFLKDNLLEKEEEILKRMSI
ncbi:MAG: DEAD/DEAH box helicase [Alkaliphilus sp.]